MDRLAEETAPALPSLSIIVPARNEKANLRRLLPSLSGASYPGEMEIIVVDDNSTDGTVVVARSYGARTIQAGEPPAGWLGKTHACQQGARAARGEWLLFADADTTHRPYTSAAAVSHALRHELDGLSLWLHNEFLGLYDGISLMVAFAALFAGRRRGNDILNGQFILLRREVYWASGGHAAVAGEAMEDLALGRRLQALGYAVPLLRGEGAGSVRMYQRPGDWWSGMARWGARSLRHTGARSLWTGALVTATMVPVLLLRDVLAGRLRLRWVAALWAVVSASYIGWARSFGRGWWAALAPLGALLVQAAATWGLIRELTGRGTRWKERTV